MIEQIGIYNYKSIREAIIPLRKINVLIGENGAGKSNFISFFEMIKALYDQRLGSYMLSNGGVEAHLYRGRKGSHAIKGIIDYKNENAFFFELRPTVDDKAYIEETGYYHNILNEQKDYSQWNRIMWDKIEYESKISESSLAKPIQIILESFVVYHFQDTSKTSPMRHPCHIDDNVMLRPDASNLPAILYKLKMTDEVAFRFIEGIIRSTFPYFKRFILQPMKTDNSRIKLVWEEIDSEMYLDAYALSDGTLRFIALTTLLLQSELPGTIIIDEPELGLHPYAIAKLAALIRRASFKSQIIIATQSVNLIDNFSIDDLILVGRRDDQSVFNRPNEKDFSVWLENYSVGELWEKNVLSSRP